MWSAWLCYDLMMLDGLCVSALPNLADSLLYPVSKTDRKAQFIVYTCPTGTLRSTDVLR